MTKHDVKAPDFHLHRWVVFMARMCNTLWRQLIMFDNIAPMTSKQEVGTEFDVVFNVTQYFCQFWWCFDQSVITDKWVYTWPSTMSPVKVKYISDQSTVVPRYNDHLYNGNFDFRRNFFSYENLLYYNGIRTIRHRRWFPATKCIF